MSSFIHHPTNTIQDCLLDHLPEVDGKGAHFRETDVVRVKRGRVVARLYAHGDDVHAFLLQLRHRRDQLLIALVGCPVRDDEHEVLPAGGVLAHTLDRLADGVGVEVPALVRHTSEEKTLSMIEESQKSNR